MNQKGLTPIAIILIIAGVLVLGGGVYWWQKSKISTPNKTIDWQTYRNEEYGFEVKYPANWIIKERNSDSDIQKTIYFALEYDRYGEPKDYGLVVDARKGTLEDIFNQPVPVGPNSNPQKFDKWINLHPDIEKTKINGIDAVKFNEIVSLHVIFAKNNTTIELSMKISEKEILNQILSTFKFTQPAATNEIYNHAGKIIKIYQKDGKDYLDIDFIKFLSFVDDKGSPIDVPNRIYGKNDEEGTCAPVADPYCIVNNDKTIKSFEVAKNTEIIPANYPGDPVSFEELETIIINSPFFELQIKDNIVQKMRQIYIP